jgi:Na+/melibiose symporter-like transporter
VRLSVNISQVYLTFYVTEVLQMDQTAVAITPLLLYLAQLLSTAASRRVAVRLGRRRAIALGSALTVAACVAMGFVQRGGSAVLIYPAVVLLGVGLALSMVICASPARRARAAARLLP